MPTLGLRLGIIGCGKMAHDFHFATLLGFDDVRIVAVCDVDTTRRETARWLVDETYAGRAPRTGRCEAFNDYRDLLARQDIDAVVIATPDHWHALILIHACEAGKDVYCEKPLTLTLAEGAACIRAAREHRRIVQTGSQQRSNAMGDFRQACEFIRSGRLGNIMTVQIGVPGPSRWCDLPEDAPEPGLDWDLWLGPAPYRPYSAVLSPRGMHSHWAAWRGYREYCGGGHADIGAHHYDIAQWALGTDDSGPVEIVPPADQGAERGVRCRYASGVEMVHGGPGGCLFTGERGTLHIDRGVLTSDPPEIVAEPLRDDETHLPVSPGHHRNWVDCIRSRERPIAHVEAGARSAAIIQLGNLAYWHRRTIQWNPHEWRFEHDSAPEAWMDYDRRPPWTLPSL